MSEDTRRLTRCLSFIKENTSKPEKILDKLIETGIVDLDERAQILTSPLLETQLHSIIEIVIRKQAHGPFLEALKSTGNNHVVYKIVGLGFTKEEKWNREKTYTIQKLGEESNEEKAQKEQYVKEKTLEELKIENDRLKTQQSIIREKLNEKHQKIQQLKMEIGQYKRQNSEMNERLKSFEELHLRMQEIEEELHNKEKMNQMIEMALGERSVEIDRLQRECEDLKNENGEKSKQIAHLNIQMKTLKEELAKASQERERLELKMIEMSESMNRKFGYMMTVLEELKVNRQAQCEVTTPRNLGSSKSHFGRKGQQYAVSKPKAYTAILSRLKR